MFNKLIPPRDGHVPYCLTLILNGQSIPDAVDVLDGPLPHRLRKTTATLIGIPYLSGLLLVRADYLISWKTTKKHVHPDHLMRQ